MKLAIFDLDGTLYDSMGVWMGTAYDFMENRGFSVPDELRDRLVSISSVEAACIFCKAFPDIGMSPEDLVAAWRDTIKLRYADSIDFKPGAREYLEQLKRAGIPICVATLTPRDYFTPAFRRTGLDELADFSINAAEAGRDKHFPDIYLRCAERFGLIPADCRVYEDSPLAARTAKDAGFEVWGVRDSLPDPIEADLRATAHRFVADWRELLDR